MENFFGEGDLRGNCWGLGMWKSGSGVWDGDLGWRIKEIFWAMILKSVSKKTTL